MKNRILLVHTKNRNEYNALMLYLESIGVRWLQNGEKCPTKRDVYDEHKELTTLKIEYRGDQLSLLTGCSYKLWYMGHASLLGTSVYDLKQFAFKTGATLTYVDGLPFLTPKTKRVKQQFEFVNGRVKQKVYAS